MGICAAVLGGLLLSQVSTTDLMGNARNPWSLYDAARAKEDVPPLAGRDESLEKSFAGQIHTTVKSPDHFNPYEWTINDMQMLQNPQYMLRYQRDIYQRRSQEPEWRLDVYFQSDLNTMDNPSSSEAPWGELSKFHENRHAARSQWLPRNLV